ncbi:hypothetical protein [Streptomyces mirabilis]
MLEALEALERLLGECALAGVRGRLDRFALRARQAPAEPIVCPHNCSRPA